MRLLLSIAVLSSLVLSACASSPRPTVSWADSNITADEIALLSSDITRYLASAVPPAQSTLAVAPVKSRRGRELNAHLLESLRAAGYGVIEVEKGERPDAGVHAIPVRYLLSRVNDGIVLHVQYQRFEASRFYPRASDGSLIQTTAFTLRELP